MSDHDGLERVITIGWNQRSRSPGTRTDNLRAQLLAAQLALESNDLVTPLTDTEVCESRSVTLADLIVRHRGGFLLRGLGHLRWLGTVISTGVADGH
jgi:hypothetical protein